MPPGRSVRPSRLAPIRPSLRRLIRATPSCSAGRRPTTLRSGHGSSKDCLPERGHCVSDEPIVEASPARRRPSRPRRRVVGVDDVSVPDELAGGVPQEAVDDPSDVAEPLSARVSETPPPERGIGDNGSAGGPGHVATGDSVGPSVGLGDVAISAEASALELVDRREFGRGPSRRRGRSGPRPAFDGPPPGRRDGPPMSARPTPPRGPNSISAPAPRPMRGVPAPYGSSLGRMPTPGDSSAGFRSIGRSPEDIARLAQEARREARLNRGRMFRAAAVGQSEPYRALGRGPATPPSSGGNGNVSDRFASGGPRPPSPPGAPRSGRPPTGR